MIKKDRRLPEKSDVVYVGGTFLKNIGFEWAFDALSIIQNTYFFIAGSGPDDEYVKDFKKYDVLTIYSSDGEELEEFTNKSINLLNHEDGELNG